VGELLALSLAVIIRSQDFFGIAYQDQQYAVLGITFLVINGNGISSDVFLLLRGRGIWYCMLMCTVYISEPAVQGEVYGANIDLSPLIGSVVLMHSYTVDADVYICLYIVRWVPGKLICWLSRF